MRRSRASQALRATYLCGRLFPVPCQPHAHVSARSEVASTTEQDFATASSAAQQLPETIAPPASARRTADAAVQRSGPAADPAVAPQPPLHEIELGIQHASRILDLVDTPEHHEWIAGCNELQLRPGRPFHGEHGGCAVATAALSDDVLAWLRQDNVFADNGASVRASWKPRHGRRVEKDRKLEVGLLSNMKDSTTVNDIKCNLPFERLKQWVQVFKYINREALEALGRQIQDELQLGDMQNLGLNGTELRDKSPVQWIFELNTMQFMIGTARFDPPHEDGGASLLLMGIGLWGRRATHLVHGGLKAIELPKIPKAAKQAAESAVHKRPASASASRPPHFRLAGFRVPKKRTKKCAAAEQSSVAAAEESSVAAAEESSVAAAEESSVAIAEEASTVSSTRRERLANKDWTADDLKTLIGDRQASSPKDN